MKMKPEDWELVKLLEEKQKELNNSKHYCVFCGEKCNPYSQACSRCVRNKRIYVCKK